MGACMVFPPLLFCFALGYNVIDVLELLYLMTAVSESILI